MFWIECVDNLIYTSMQERELSNNSLGLTNKHSLINNLFILRKLSKLIRN